MLRSTRSLARRWNAGKLKLSTDVPPTQTKGQNANAFQAQRTKHVNVFQNKWFNKINGENVSMVVFGLSGVGFGTWHGIENVSQMHAETHLQKTAVIGISSTVGLAGGFLAGFAFSELAIIAVPLFVVVNVAAFCVKT